MLKINWNEETITFEMSKDIAKNLWYQLCNSVDILREDRSVSLLAFDPGSEDYERINNDFNYFIDANIEMRQCINYFLFGEGLEM